MSPDLTQGGLANSSGNTLEQTVRAVFKSKGFEIVNHRELRDHPERFGNELLILNVPYTSLYGHTAKSEFVVVSQKYGLEIRIECRWQQSSGSVDEKYPYLYLNCIERMPEREIFLILGGGGAKAGAVEWLKNAAKQGLYTTEESKNKKVWIMTIEDFLKWANRVLR